MGLSQSLKDFYYRLEDKYYAFLDRLEEHGINLYPLTDSIESTGVPSFPIVGLLLLILFGVMVYFLLGALGWGIGGANQTVRLSVTNVSGDPVENASVTFSWGSEPAVIKSTNGLGLVSVDLPVGARVTYMIQKEEYRPLSDVLVVEAGMPTLGVRLERALSTISRDILLKAADSKEIVSSPVTLRFACSGTDFETEATSENGLLSVRDIPENCGLLQASVVGSGSLVSGSIDITQGSPELLWEASSNALGVVRVVCTDTSGNAIPGIRTTLVRFSGGLFSPTLFSAESTPSGIAEMQGVPTGLYAIQASDPTGEFAPFDGTLEGGEQSLSANATLEFQVVMEKTAAGVVSVLVKDAQTGLPVGFAKVSVREGTLLVNSATTDPLGKADLSVPKNASYALTIEHPDHPTAGPISVSPSSTPFEVLLAPPSKSEGLLVRVEDSRGNPIPFAEIVLRNSDQVPLGDPRVTGVDGTFRFTNVEAGKSFSVLVSKKGLLSVESDLVSIAARANNELTVTMEASFGTIELTIVDEQGEPIAGARVLPLDASNLAPFSNRLTSSDSSGLAVFQLRQDEMAVFKVSADGFLPHYSDRVIPDPDAVVERKMMLVADSGKFEARLLGLFAHGEALSDNQVAAGGAYEAEFAVIVPGLEKSADAGLFVRTGEVVPGKSVSAGQDNVFISKVSAAGKIVRGETFSPPHNEAVDFQHLGGNESKWASVTWSGFGEGVFLARVGFAIRGDAAEGEIARLAYRAFNKQGASINRLPLDAELKNASSTTEKQGLYANTYEEILTVGTPSVCNGSFCRKYQIENLSTQETLAVSDRFDARQNTSYKLGFSITSTAASATNAKLVVESDGNTLELGEYQVLSANGQSFKGTATGNRLELDVGAIEKSTTIAGTIVFTPLQSGSTGLRIRLEGDASLEDTIIVDVPSLKEMTLEAIPKELVPFLDNKVVVRLSDFNAPLGDALVSVRVNDSMVFSGKTDRNGLLGFTLSKPPTGGVVVIRGEKRDYAPAELKIKIDDSVLSVIPSQITFNLTAAEFDKESETLVINRTSVPLILKGMRFSADYKKFVELSVPNESEIANKALASGEDQNAFIRAKLTDAALELREPRTIKGSVTFLAATDGTLGSKTFSTSVPLWVHIGLPGSLDQINCLQVSPEKWEFSTSTSHRSIEITITNSCAVDKINVPLRELAIGIRSAGDTNGANANAGSFSLLAPDSEVIAPKKIRVGSFETIVPLFAAGASEKAVLEFAPDSSNFRSGRVKAEITLKALHKASSKDESVSDALQVNGTVSNLAECVIVRGPAELVVDATPFNLGYGQLGSYTGYNPLSSNYYLNGGYANAGAYGFNGYAGNAMGYPSLGYANSPYYGNSFIDGGYSNGYSNEIGLNPADPGRLQTYGAGNTSGFLSYATPQTYPAPNYSGYMQTQYFDSAYSNQFSFDPGAASLTVENTCVVPVDILSETSGGIFVLPPQFSLNANERRTLSIQPGYRLGRYQLTIFTRPKGGEESFMDIARIPVIVNRMGELLDDCIKLSSREISLSSFIGKPVAKKVYNYCYDLGVRLPKAGQLIDFSCRLPGVSNESSSTLLYGESNQRTNSRNSPASPKPKALFQSYYSGTPVTYQNSVLPGYAYSQPGYTNANYYGPTTNSGFVTVQNQADLQQYYAAPGGVNYSNQAYTNTWPPENGNGYYSPPGQGYRGYFPSNDNYYGGPSYQGDYSGSYLSNAYQSSRYGNNDASFQFNSEGQCPLVSDIYITGSHVTEDDGTSIQEVEFEVRPDLQYRKQFCRLKADLPYETIFGWRVTASGAYYRSNVDATANIHFTNQFGQPDTKYEHVKLKDAWGIGETADACIENAQKEINRNNEPGNCDAPTSACIEQTHLNLSTRFAGSAGFVPQEFFDNDTAILPLSPNAFLVGGQACGSRDSIVNILPASKDDASGVHLEFLNEKHNIALKIERGGMKTQCAKLSGTIEVEIDRPACYHGSQPVSIPYSVFVLAPGKFPTDKDAIDGTCATKPFVHPFDQKPDQNQNSAAFEVRACGQNGKGIEGEVHLVLGLDKLEYAWDKTKIDSSYCDLEKADTESFGTKDIPRFCDATMFTMELEKKAEEIGRILTLAGFSGSTTLESGKLANIVFKTATLGDKEVVLDEEDKILRDTQAVLPKAIQDQLEKIAKMPSDSPENQKAIVDAMENLLASKEWGNLKDSIVVRYDSEKINDEDDKKILSFILSAKKISNNQQFEYFTLNEYQIFHNLVVDCDNATEPCTLTRNIKSGDRTRTLEADLKKTFFDHLLQADLTVYPALGVEKANEQYTQLSSSAGKNGTLTPDQAKQLEKLLDFNVFLQKDEYSEDFETAYETSKVKGDYFKADKWTFAPLGGLLNEPGLYKVKMKINTTATELKEANFEVEFKLLKDLDSMESGFNKGKDPKSQFHYSSNPLFWLPVNAPLRKNVFKLETAPAFQQLASRTTWTEGAPNSNGGDYAQNLINLKVGQSLSNNEKAILKLSRDGIEWNPTRVLVMKAELGASQQTGLVYSPKNIPSIEATGSSLMKWFDASDNLYHADERKVPTGFCQASNPYFTVILGPSARKLTGVLIAQEVESNDTGGLEIVCARGAGKVGNSVVEESNLSKTAPTRSSLFDTQYEITNKTNEKSQLYAWINQAVAKNINNLAPTCTYLENDGFSVEWNLDQVVANK